MMESVAPAVHNTKYSGSAMLGMGIMASAPQKNKNGVFSTSGVCISLEFRCVVNNELEDFDFHLL